MILALDLRNSRRQRHSIIGLLFVGKEDSQWRRQERARNNQQGKHDQERSAAAETHQYTDQLFCRFCRSLDQPFRCCSSSSGRAGIALFEHLPLGVLSGHFLCPLRRSS